MIKCNYYDEEALYEVTSYYADDEYGGISKCTGSTYVCEQGLAKMNRLYSDLEYTKVINSKHAKQ